LGVGELTGFLQAAQDASLPRLNSTQAALVALHPLSAPTAAAAATEALYEAHAGFSSPARETAAAEVGGGGWAISDSGATTRT
jgi:hypothetical protein